MKFLKYGVAIALIAVIALSVAGCSKEPLAATVNGKKVTIAEVDERLTQLVGQHNEMFKGAQGEQMKQQFRQRVLDQLIEMELIMQEVEKQGIKVSDKDVDAQVKEMMKQYGIKDEKALEEALKKQNMTLAQFREEVTKRMQIEKLGEKLTKNVKVSEKEIKAYYEKNKASFVSKDRIRASHILVQKEEDAKKILADLKAGADFAKLAKEKSVDTGSKDKGGEMPWTDKDQFAPEFANACWNMKPGQISEPVKTSYGFHIIKLIDKEAGSQKTYDEVKGQIKKQLLDEKKRDVFAKWLADLKKKAEIKTYLAENTPESTATPSKAQGSGQVPPAQPSAKPAK